MYPMWFMLITAAASLGLIIKAQLADAATPNYVLGGIAIVLLVLAVVIARQAFAAFKNFKNLKNLKKKK
ncbi:hypothetical protein FACS1894187_25110 [Synergistales bacterium]|nr:hypothetical protein FACS1894187_25110 [Synergistales bacterium]